MRWGDIAEVALLAAVLGTAIYMNHRGKSAPAPEAAPAAAPSGFATFCSRAHLVPKAFDDCRRAMGAAKTDAERVAVEHRFAMGNVSIDKPAMPP